MASGLLAAGGFAEREGKTFSGRLQILKNQANELEALRAAVKHAGVPNVDPAAATSWAASSRCLVQRNSDGMRSVV